jgi:hypothetical protein
MSALARAQRRSEEGKLKGELPDYIKCQVLRQLNDALMSRLKEAENTIARMQEKLVPVDPDLSPIIETVMKESGPQLLQETLAE